MLTLVFLHGCGSRHESGGTNVKEPGGNPRGTRAGDPREASASNRPGAPSSGRARTPDGRLGRGRRGGTFVRADIQELDTLNIVTTRSRTVYAVLKLVFEGLLSVNPLTGRIQGGIASDYTVTNDGFSLVLRLNENVRFSDGRPCTADDVVFSFEEIYMNPEVDSRKTDALTIRGKLVSIKKLDDFTVRFDLPVPFRPFLYTLAHTEILPKHVLAPLIERNGIQYFNRTYGSVDANHGPALTDLIGTGPYAVTEFKPGEYLKLRRNAHYGRRKGTLSLDGAPYLDEIVELLELDDETRILKFQVGELDFYDIKDTDIASGDLENLYKNSREGKYEIVSGGQTQRSSHVLVFNQNPDSVEKEKLDVFRNVLFRRAVSHLIDRAAICRETYGDHAYLDASPERSVSPFYKKQEPLAYDTGAANELLSRVPLKDRDNDRFLDLPSGRPFGFTILTNEDNPFRVKMGGMITDSLRRAGLNASFKPLAYDPIVEKLLVTFDWDCVVIGFEAAIEPNESSWIWESKGRYHLWSPYGEKPATAWEARVDELFALGRTTWDFDQAKVFYDEFQDIVARELPVINILVPSELYGVRNGFRNLVPVPVTENAIGIMPFVNRRR
jgi:peptide/nickel transport system substrate-binding protein